MRIDGEPRRTIWVAEDRWTVPIFDQVLLPHELEAVALADLGKRSWSQAAPVPVDDAQA